MGLFGITIGGSGPADYTKDGLGADAEAAISKLLKTLETLGFAIAFAAIYGSPETAWPSSPVELEPALEEGGPFKCPACGRQYADPGTCEGGEYAHPPETLLPTAEVLAEPSSSSDEGPASASALAVSPPLSEPPAPASPPDEKAAPLAQTSLPAPDDTSEAAVVNPDAAPPAPVLFPTL